MSRREREVIGSNPRVIGWRTKKISGLKKSEHHTWWKRAKNVSKEDIHQFVKFLSSSCWHRRCHRRRRRCGCRRRRRRRRLRPQRILIVLCNLHGSHQTHLQIVNGADDSNEMWGCVSCWSFVGSLLLEKTKLKNSLWKCRLSFFYFLKCQNILHS